MTDTAEYWEDIKRNHPYVGPNYYHVAGFKCGHRHFYEAKTLTDVNCRSCLKLIKNGATHSLPLGETKKQKQLNDLDLIKGKEHLYGIFPQDAN